MKKLLGILVLGLLLILPVSKSYAEISYTCYLTSFPQDSGRTSSITFGKVRFHIAANGSVHTAVDYKIYFPDSENKEDINIWAQWLNTSVKLISKEITYKEFRESMKELNPFLNEKTEFSPEEKNFWDVRHAVGGIIQTTKELTRDNSVEFWDFDLNKPEAVYNIAYTPGWVKKWNESWDQLSAEDKKKYKRVSTKPWLVERYTDCKASDQSVPDQVAASGTAFFIDRKGHLLTNNHVVEGCKLQKINYFNKEYDTELITTDKTLDLALLKVDLKPRAFISFSKKEPKKRQLVIVAGYPLGKYLSDDLKINEGKISSLKGFENNSNEITVDLAINPGNSGGPIVDENGQLVAVAVAGMSKEVTEGISFGIKSSAVTNFLKTNKISPDIKLTSFSMNDEEVNQLLEESTVYIFCEK